MKYTCTRIKIVLSNIKYTRTLYERHAKRGRGGRGGVNHACYFECATYCDLILPIESSHSPMYRSAKWKKNSLNKWWARWGNESVTMLNYLLRCYQGQPFSSIACSLQALQAGGRGKRKSAVTDVFQIHYALISIRCPVYNQLRFNINNCWSETNRNYFQLYISIIQESWF